MPRRPRGGRAVTAVLVIAWLVVTGLGVACASFFAHGLIRDHHWGDPEIPIDLSQAGGWQERPLRPLGSGRYTLWLQTVNHVPPFDVPYAGQIEVVLRDPSGAEALRRTIDGAETVHVRPQNNHWTDLGEAELNGWPLRPWVLAACVTRADPVFAGCPSSLMLRKQRYDPGMGGMLNYVMIFPAAALLLVSLGLSLWLSARRVWSPLLMTGIAWILLFGALTLLRG